MCAVDADATAVLRRRITKRTTSLDGPRRSKCCVAAGGDLFHSKSVWIVSKKVLDGRLTGKDIRYFVEDAQLAFRG